MGCAEIGASLYGLPYLQESAINSQCLSSFLMYLPYLLHLWQCILCGIQRGGSGVGSMGSHLWERESKSQVKAVGILFIVEGNTACCLSVMKGGNRKKHQHVPVDLCL